MHGDEDALTPVPAAVARLRREHERVQEQLAILATNASRLLSEEGTLEIDLVLEVLQDLLEYVDDVHRPRESAVLALIAERTGSAPAFVDDLERQHERIREHGTRLLERLGRVAADVPVARQEIEDVLVAFTTEVRAHFEVGESGFFAAAASLTARDWERLERLDRA
jgi:hemerythrin-like domain-containing protein